MGMKKLLVLICGLLLATVLCACEKQPAPTVAPDTAEVAAPGFEYAPVSFLDTEPSAPTVLFSEGAKELRLGGIPTSLTEV